MNPDLYWVFNYVNVLHDVYKCVFLRDHVEIHQLNWKWKLKLKNKSKKYFVNMTTG